MKRSSALLGIALSMLITCPALALETVPFKGDVLVRFKIGRGKTCGSKLKSASEVKLTAMDLSKIGPDRQSGLSRTGFSF